jgi:hypothetical protein
VEQVAMMEVVKKPFIGFKITNIRFRKRGVASKNYLYQ